MGTNLLAIDRRAHELIRRAGAESCYIDYHPSFGASPFGKVICTSVNDAVLHGLPFDYAVRDGDLVSLDFAVSIDGWVADSAVSFVVGTPRDEDLALIDTTERALDAAIAAAVIGNRIGDISHAIAEVERADGYAINTDFGGHGVGRVMHGDPHIPNDGKAGRGYPLRAGLVVALEPWLLAHTDELDHRSGRLDPPQRRRVARSAFRAHRGDHRGRSDRADGPLVPRRRLTPSALEQATLDPADELDDGRGVGGSTRASPDSAVAASVARRTWATPSKVSGASVRLTSTSSVRGGAGSTGARRPSPRSPPAPQGAPKTGSVSSGCSRRSRASAR